MSSKESRPPTLGEVAEVVNHACRLISAQMANIARVWSESMRRFWDSPDGQQLAAIVKFYDEHPEELAALRVACPTLRLVAFGHRHTIPGWQNAWRPEGVGADAAC